MIELIITGWEADHKRVWKVKGAIELKTAQAALRTMVQSRKRFNTRVLRAVPGSRLTIGYGDLPDLISSLAPFAIMTGSIPEPYQHTYTFSMYRERALHFSRFITDVEKYARRYPEFCDQAMFRQLR